VGSRPASDRDIRIEVETAFVIQFNELPTLKKSRSEGTAHWSLEPPLDSKIVGSRPASACYSRIEGETASFFSLT
jgi:hypothetical protein